MTLHFATPRNPRTGARSAVRAYAVCGRRSGQLTTSRVVFLHTLGACPKCLRVLSDNERRVR